ncbi:MAG: Do family serine endopeptidase [Simkania negevensis]|nr:Do family serine endopeptidase [Simkania negevensis]
MQQFLSIFIILSSLVLGQFHVEALTPIVNPNKTSEKTQEIASSNAIAAPSSMQKDSPTKAFSRPFINVAKSATPAVVFIKAETGPEYATPSNPYDDFFNDDFFNHFFGPRKRRAPQPQLSQGSGFILSNDGYVMTNFHVVKGAKKISLILHDGGQREVSASFIGGDEQTDVAILKIDESFGKNFPFLKLGNSDDVEVGEWVIAIGSPFQLEATVTSGIISAKARNNLKITDWDDFLQTDAPINPGNSGGPLLNLDGEVVGMNTAIVSRSGGYMGIGFAIPSSILHHVKEQLIATGSVSRGFLGITMQPLTPDLAEAFGMAKGEGALVADVVEGSPADNAGVKQGDIITKVNDKEIKGPNDLRSAMFLMQPNSEVKLTINRAGKTIVIPVVLGSLGENSKVSNATPAKLLGLSVDNLTPDMIKQYHLDPADQGVVIVEIETGSPAARAGLRPGVVIFNLNHQKITNVEDFKKALKTIGKQKQVLVGARQGKMTQFFSLKVE